MSRHGRSVRPLALILGVSASAAVVLLAASSSQRPQANPGRDAVPADVRVAETREWTADTARVLIDIKGMYCASCEETVRAMLMRTAGVRRAEVSAKSGRATVIYDRSKTSPATILAAVTRLGYDARIHQEEKTGTGADA